MDKFLDTYQQCTDDVIHEIRAILHAVDPEILKQVIQDIEQAQKVYVVGVGRVLLSLQAFVKRLAQLGIDAHYVGEITEPAITEHDILLVGSGSGASLFPLGIAKKARELGAKVIHIGSNPNSEMKDIAAYMLRVPTRTKLNLADEMDSCQPMSTLFEQTLLILGDVIAKLIIDKKQMELHTLWQYHANLE